VKAARIIASAADVVLVPRMCRCRRRPKTKFWWRVMAAGVAPWECDHPRARGQGLARNLRSPSGSDFSGVVEKVGPGVTGFGPPRRSLMRANPQFCGAQAEFAVAASG